MKRRRTGVPPVACLLLLCLLWSLDSIRSDLLPDLIPNLVPQTERQALPFALLAVVATLIAVLRKAVWPRGRRLRDAVLIGLGLFVAPAALVHLANQWVSDLTRVALFSLAPVFAVVLEPYIGRGEVRQGKGVLGAALAAVCGTLCILPLQTPDSFEIGFAFCFLVLAAACVAATNCLAVSAVVERAGESIAPMAAIAGLTAVAGLSALNVLTARTVWGWSALGPALGWAATVELTELLLLFWLLRRMSASRMTIRFVLGPLITILVELVLLRPTVEPRAALGLLLMAGGTIWLLFAPEVKPRADSLPLNLNR